MIEISSILDVKKHIGGLEAVIFDLDDTLYSEKEYVRSGYKKVAELFPNIDNVEEKLWRLFESGKPAIDTFLELEDIYSNELKQKCVELYRNHVPNIHLYDGVYEMLKYLRGKYKLGIITDGRPQGQRAKISALRLENLIQEIIITDDLGGIEYRKPNAAAFEIMAERMGLSFSGMCYIGDNIKKDFVAPEKLGMKSIWVNNPAGIYCGLVTIAGNVARGIWK